MGNYTETTRERQNAGHPPGALKPMKACFAGLAALTALAAVGCGGEDVFDSATVQPRIAVDWDDRSRALDAPNSALSVRVVLDSLTAGVDTIEITGNRGATTSAHTSTYTAIDSTQSGLFNMSVTFYAEQNLGGAVVGTASLQVRVLSDGSIVRPDGSELGSVGYTGEVDRVEVAINQKVEVGETRELAVIALDEDGDPIILSRGSFTFELISGGEFIDLDEDGTVTGEALGTAFVTASVDGVTSDQTAVVVTNTP